MEQRTKGVIRTNLFVAIIAVAYNLMRVSRVYQPA